MQRLWSAEELGERWTLGAEDLALLVGLPDTGKLGLAAQLAYWGHAIEGDVLERLGLGHDRADRVRAAFRPPGEPLATPLRVLNRSGGAIGVPRTPADSGRGMP